MIRVESLATHFTNKQRDTVERERFFWLKDRKEMDEEQDFNCVAPKGNCSQLMWRAFY
jgi:hypothetical protein